MSELDITALKKIIQDNGVKDTMLLLVDAFNELADEYSDIGLKEKCIDCNIAADNIEEALFYIVDDDDDIDPNDKVYIGGQLAFDEIRDTLDGQ
jgi:hypothetical protein